MADQEEPITRRVALKIVNVGTRTKQIVARFEAERQALALMNHSSIGKIFDGGTTGDGQPFLIMELVKGVPLNSLLRRAQIEASRPTPTFCPNL